MATKPLDEPPPLRAARGLRIREFCAREGIDRRTAWRWAEKGLVQVSRLAPRVGVRVRYVREPDR